MQPSNSTPLNLTAFQFGDIVRVEWLDAHNHDPGWLHAEDIEPELAIVHSVGYWLRATEHEVLLSGDVMDDHTTNTRVAIPIGCVRKIDRLIHG